MIELNTMEFDGKTYFEIETINHNNNTYIYYGNEEDTSLFKIFKTYAKISLKNINPT